MVRVAGEEGRNEGREISSLKKMGSVSKGKATGWRCDGESKALFVLGGRDMKEEGGEEM